MKAATALLALFSSGLVGRAAGAQDWPWWRGTARDGVAADDDWQTHGRELWRREVGVGFASASVVGERLWTLGHARETRQDTLWCLDARTGATLWSASFPARTGGFGVHAGGPLSTPTVGGGCVYVTSNEGVLRAVEAETGALVWSVDLPRALGTKPDEYGLGASPLLLGNSLVVCADRVARFDARSGALLWRSEPFGVYHSTPAPFTASAGERLAVFGDRATALLDLVSGATLGSHPSRDLHIGGSIATPLVLGEDVLVSAGDGVGATRLDFSSTPPRVVWHTRGMRNLMAGCVRVGERLYGFDESILKCLDLDGRERWRERGLGDGSLSAAGGRLLVLTSAGELVVARATDTGFEELARRALFEAGDCWAPPVFAHGRIYARSSLGELVCLDQRGPVVPESVSGAGADREAPAEAAAPAARDLFARHLELVGGRESLLALRSLRRSGTFQRRSVGVTRVPAVLEELAPDRRRAELGLPRGLRGQVVRVFDGEEAWELNPIRGDARLAAAEQREARDEPGLHAAATFERDHREFGAVVGAHFAGRSAWKVVTTLASGRARNYYFDAQTGCLLGRDGPEEATVVLGDWRVERGLAFPMLERREEHDTGALEVLRFESLQLDGVADEGWARPEDLPIRTDEQGPK